MKDNTKTLEETSLKDYLLIAHKLIVIIAPKFRDGLDIEMLANEDAVSNVAYLIMRADQNWDGRGNRYGFRKQCGIWAIQSYLGKKKKKMSLKIKTEKVLSLNRKNDIVLVDHEHKNLLKVLVDKTAGDPLDYLIEKERLEILTGLIDKLAKVDRKCIIMRYYDCKNLSQISAQVGYSTEHVRKKIKKISGQLYREYQRLTQ